MKPKPHQIAELPPETLALAEKLNAVCVNAPRRLKVEIELDEETAALVWANRTWEGREKYTIAEIVKDLAEEEAAKYRNTFPKAVERVKREYAALANAQGLGPEPLRSSGGGSQ